MSRLRVGVFHRTDVEGYRGIRKCGQIIPNDGTLSPSYPQSKGYYGYSKGYICLFDFESAREEDYRANHHMWAQFFYDGKPVTIVLKLNREKLAAKLIPNSSRPKPGDACYKPAIAYVEAWYPDPIPLSSVDGAIVTRWDSKRDLLLINEFSNLEEMWLSICGGELSNTAT
jgi:hypothetical protein